MELKIKKEFKELIPPLSADEFKGLEENIIENGCLDTIKTWDGFIIDGHNRYDICTRNEISYETKELAFEDEAHARVWIRNLQLDRRNISTEIRLDLRLSNKEEILKIQARAKENLQKQVELMNRNNPKKQKDSDLYNYTNHKNDNSTPLPPVNTRAEIAKLSGVSEFKVMQQKKLKETLPPEQYQKVLDGEVTVNKAYTELKKAETPEIIPTINEIPEKKYRVLYANPDWGKFSIEKLKSLPVGEMAAENSVLYMWIPNNKIKNGIIVGESWGFTQMDFFVWNNSRPDEKFPYHTKTHQACFIFKKGNCEPDDGIIHKSVQFEDCGYLPKKPDCIRQTLESQYLEGAKALLFTTTPYNGWDNIEFN